MRIENLPKIITRGSPNKDTVASNSNNKNDQIAKETEKQLVKQDRDRTALSERAEAENTKRQLKAEAEAGKAAAEAQSKLFSDFAKCLLIAQRILKGDRVSGEDSLFLQENNPDLYKQSITMRVKNTTPKTHETISASQHGIEETQAIEEIQIDTPIETETSGAEQSDIAL